MFSKKKFEDNHIPVLLTKEPGATDLGKHVRAILAHRTFALDPIAEFLLFSADRAQHMKEVVIPALEQGFVVISDRMADSARAYQGFGRGLDLTMIETVTDWVMQGIKPDVTLYIALDPAVAWQRIQGRGEVLTSFEQEQKNFFMNVVRGFETLYNNRNDVMILDGLLSLQELSMQATQSVLSRFNQRALT